MSTPTARTASSPGCTAALGQPVLEQPHRRGVEAELVGHVEVSQGERGVDVALRDGDLNTVDREQRLPLDLPQLGNVAAMACCSLAVAQLLTANEAVRSIRYASCQFRPPAVTHGLRGSSRVHRLEKYYAQSADEAVRRLRRAPCSADRMLRSALSVSVTTREHRPPPLETSASRPASSAIAPGALAPCAGSTRAGRLASCANAPGQSALVLGAAPSEPADGRRHAVCEALEQRDL